MRPIWALREVPIGALLPNTRDRATVVGVERDGTNTTGDTGPASPLSLALAIDSMSLTSPPMITTQKPFSVTHELIVGWYVSLE